MPKTLYLVTPFFIQTNRHELNTSGQKAETNPMKKMIRLSAIFVGTLTSAAAICQTSTRTPKQAVDEFIRDNPKKSTNDLLEFLAKSFPQMFIEPVLMFRSESLHKNSVSYETPRAILSSKDGKYVIAFSGDIKNHASSAIEELSFEESSAKFELREISLASGTLTAERNPQKCIQCHGSDPRPIWDAYDMWPGAYAGNNSRSFGENDEKGIKAFRKEMSHNSRYMLLHGPGIDQSLDYSFGPLGDAEASPAILNERLSNPMTAYQLRKLKELKNFPLFKAAFLSASLGCRDFQKWLPAKSEWHSTEGFSSFFKKLEKNMAETRKQREQRARSAAGLNKDSELEDDGIDADGLARAYWVLQLSGGDYQNFMFNFNRTDPQTLVSTPFSSFPFNTIGALLPQSHSKQVSNIGFSDIQKDDVAIVSQTLPNWKKIVGPELSEGDDELGKETLYKVLVANGESQEEHEAYREKICKKFDLILKELNSLEMSKASSSSLTNPIDTDVELCLASRFSYEERAQITQTINQCAECHANAQDTDTPQIDFKTPSILARLLVSRPTQQASTHVTLNSEIVARLNSTNPDFRMPPQVTYSQELQKLMKRYFDTCAEKGIKRDTPNSSKKRDH